MSTVIDVSKARDQLSDSLAEAARMIGDNPGPALATFAAAVVATRAAMNVVRPRTPLQAACLMVVLELALPRLAVMAARHGVMRWYARDEDGHRVPIFTAE